MDSSSEADDVKREEPLRLAVLDMGSTSFHLLVADVGGDGSITPVSRERVMLHLGAALGADGYMSEEVCEEAVTVVRMLREVAIREQAVRCTLEILSRFPLHGGRE